MKKISQEVNLFNKDLVKNNDLATDTTKTTNVNILLNRVRLDKRKNFKKKIIFLSLLVSIMSAITIFLII